MIRPADRARDSAALCALARLCPQGRRLRFYHERTDYWERGRLQPRLDIYVAEEAGELTAAISVARKELWIGGVRETAAYVHDLMVRPDCRGRGLGRELIRTVRAQCPEVRLLYCYILEDNDASRGLFAAEGFTPYPRRLLYHALLPRLARLRPPAWQSLREEALQQSIHSRRDFVDVTSTHDGLFALRRDGSTAWASLRRLDAQVFVAMPRLLAAVANVLPLLPAAGRAVRTWALHHVGYQGDVAVLRRLLRGLAWEATRANIDAVVVPLFEDDPFTAEVSARTLTGWGIAPGVARLYVAGEAAGRVLEATRPLVLNAQDA